MDASDACEQVINVAKLHNLVVVLRGIPGSGKSYFKGLLEKSAEELGITFSASSADDYFVKENVYQFNPKYLRKAHSYCQEKFNVALGSKKRLVLVDNTNTQHWEYEPYLQEAKRFKYEIRIVEMGCDNVVMAQKFANRNNHGVPVSKVIAMYDRWDDDDTAIVIRSAITNDPSDSNIPDYAAARYTGIFLTNESQKLLRKKILPFFKNIHCDHVTLQFQPSKEDILELPFGEKCGIAVIGTAQDDKCQAAVVEINNSSVCSANKHPHVTISVDSDVGAGYSNELLERGTIKHLNEKIALEGVVGIKLKTEKNGIATVTKAPKRLVYAGIEYVLKDTLEPQQNAPVDSGASKHDDLSEDVSKKKKRRNKKKNNKTKKLDEENTNVDDIHLDLARGDNGISNLSDLSLQDKIANSSAEQTQQPADRSVIRGRRGRTRKNSNNGQNTLSNQNKELSSASLQNSDKFGEEAKVSQGTKDGKKEKKHRNKKHTQAMKTGNDTSQFNPPSDPPQIQMVLNVANDFPIQEQAADVTGKGKRNKKKKSRAKALSTDSQPNDYSILSNSTSPLQDSEQLREPSTVDAITDTPTSGTKKDIKGKNKQARKQVAPKSIKEKSPQLPNSYTNRENISSTIAQGSSKIHSFDDRVKCLLCDIGMK